MWPARSVTRCPAGSADRLFRAGREPDHLAAGRTARRQGRQVLGARLPVVGAVELQRLVLGSEGLDVLVALHAGAGRDELADDDVLLEAHETVGTALDGGLGEHTRRLLEGGGG